MNSQQKFIFGIIVTVAITISTMVASCNLKQRSDYELCIESVETQSLHCYDRRVYHSSDNIHKRNIHNSQCMSKTEVFFDKCEMLNR